MEKRTVLDTKWPKAPGGLVASSNVQMVQYSANKWSNIPNFEHLTDLCPIHHLKMKRVWLQTANLPRHGHLLTDRPGKENINQRSSKELQGNFGGDAQLRWENRWTGQ
ncbi:hypothetical protein XENOCAPTIV_026431 [Xenoophorus captivus]|uniref:Uncharacterized protein n=1 Tax=Xenoophorus captivus TaxID=1517983 RepID=A0ABV0RIX0_9TELE